MPVLIPHGTTPTGFGLRQRSKNGALRPISPCCGRSLRGAHVACNGCGTSYQEMTTTLRASLCNDISVVPGKNNQIALLWMRKVTGLPTLEMEVSA